jgi:hypothetical protein
MSCSVRSGGLEKTEFPDKPLTDLDKLCRCRGQGGKLRWLERDQSSMKRVANTHWDHVRKFMLFYKVFNAALYNPLAQRLPSNIADESAARLHTFNSCFTFLSSSRFFIGLVVIYMMIFTGPVTFSNTGEINLSQASHNITDSAISGSYNYSPASPRGRGQALDGINDKVANLGFTWATTCAHDGTLDILISFIMT